MQDIEFTIQKGRLYMLQCRVGKRTAFAAIKIAVDMVGEKLIGEKEALRRVEPDQLNQLLRPIFDQAEKDAAIKAGRLLAKGLNAGPGAATGKVVFNAVDAEGLGQARGEDRHPDPDRDLARGHQGHERRRGHPDRARRHDLSRRPGRPADGQGLRRRLRRPRHRLRRTYDDRQGRTFKEGDWISIDGTTGEVIEGKIHTRPSEVLQVLVEKTLDRRQGARLPDFRHADDVGRQVPDPEDPDQRRPARPGANAVAFGAEGIGLCRTEHMFFGEGKIGPMREMILADTLEERKAALAKLLPYQRDDFAGIFEVMAGRPVTIRTLDPPLHEFLPARRTRSSAALAAKMGMPKKVRERVESLHEFNPMLGLPRLPPGHRLSRDHRDAGAGHLRSRRVRRRRKGQEVLPEVMIPLVGHVKELANQEAIVRRTAARS